jgi:leucine dehydrogenase
MRVGYRGVIMAVEILDVLARQGFEELIAINDPGSGLRAFLAVHDTSVGPAFGGIRAWTYQREDEALRDCLRLARAMTAKCVMAGLPAGGAKLVVLDRPELRREAAYRHLGRVIERLGGRFYSGPDVGTGPRELAWLASETRFVTHPGDEGPGELPESTCAGVIAGMGAALRHLDGAERWRERRVVVQGLGEVGSRVARTLVDLGATVLAAEIDSERAEALCSELGVERLDPAREYDPPCDVFSPCAMSGILHDLSIARLQCRVVAGAANNVLALPQHGRDLFERGVLYVPDFLINAGALIRGARFHLEGVREDVTQIGAQIAAGITALLGKAEAEHAPPVEVAVREAEARLAARRAESSGHPGP